MTLTCVAIETLTYLVLLHGSAHYDKMDRL